MQAANSPACWRSTLIRLNSLVHEVLVNRADIQCVRPVGGICMSRGLPYIHPRPRCDAVTFAAAATQVELPTFSAARIGVLRALQGHDATGAGPRRLAHRGCAMTRTATLRVNGDPLAPDRPFSLRWVRRWRSVTGQAAELDRLAAVARTDRPQDDPAPGSQEGRSAGCSGFSPMEPARCSLVSSFLEIKHNTEIPATLWNCHRSWGKFTRPQGAHLLWSRVLARATAKPTVLGSYA